MVSKRAIISHLKDDIRENRLDIIDRKRAIAADLRLIKKVKGG